ncbi:MAG: two-component system activity regulator YycH [Bacillota bacterium]|nr:two-component system activity regulator YycH [Bacillota bacterium]
MLEKVKSILLILLIMMSLVLTYTLWFGRPPLQEGVVPRYEYAYFTHPLLLSEIIQPSKILFYEEENVLHLYRRGDQEYVQLWDKGLDFLDKRLEMHNAKIISKEDVDGLFETFSSKIVYLFKPYFPLEYLMKTTMFPDLEIERAIILWEEESVYVILEGNGNLLFPLSRAEELYAGIIPEGRNPHILLSASRTLRIPAEEEPHIPLEESTDDKDIQDIQGIEEEIIVNGSEEDENAKELHNWEIEVSGDIFIQEADIWAAEVILKKEEINYEQLVRAFFFDLSMARRIEERDGALYFTNGEKGLRIYPSGLLEYAAPRLERVFSNMSYGTALQKGAESQSLYGGWLPDMYLSEAIHFLGGYRFLWSTFHEGLPLEGENTGSEMVINEQGVSYYRRSFHIVSEEIYERKPFRPYDEAIYRVLSLNREYFIEHPPVLLSMEPVYYRKKTDQAVPAWAVHFEGLGIVYLHWITLDPL